MPAVSPQTIPPGSNAVAFSAVCFEMLHNKLVTRQVVCDNITLYNYGG